MSQLIEINQTEADGTVKLLDVDGITEIPMPQGLVVEWTASSSGDAPGVYPITIDPYSVTVTMGGVDVKDQYKIRLNAGELEIISSAPSQEGYIIQAVNFDTLPDWQSAETITGTQPGTINWGAPQSFQTPLPFTDYRASRGQLENKLKQVFTISNATSLRPGGKALQCNYELGNFFVGGHLGLFLGLEGYDELYVRYWIKYEDGWKFRTASPNSAVQKWFRLMSSIDDPRDPKSANPTDMYAVPNQRPDWKHNCSVANGGTGGSPSGNFDPEVGLYMCGKQAYMMFSSANIVGTFGLDRMAYNPEGHTGSVSDPTQLLDSSTRLYWKDNHGKLVVGASGDFPWASTNAAGTDWQGNGEWVLYEIHAKMNTPGSNNFLAEIFIDGNKVAQVSDLELRKLGKTKFNYVMIPDNMTNAVYFESPGEQKPYPDGVGTFSIADIVVYTPLGSSDPLWSASPKDGRLPINYVPTTTPQVPVVPPVITPPDGPKSVVLMHWDCDVLPSPCIMSNIGNVQICQDSRAGTQNPGVLIQGPVGNAIEAQMTHVRYTFDPGIIPTDKGMVRMYAKHSNPVNSGDSTERHMFLVGVASQANYLAAYQYQDKLYFIIYGSDGAFRRVYGVTTWEVNQWYLYAFEWDSSKGYIAIWRDGQILMDLTTTPWTSALPDYTGLLAQVGSTHIFGAWDEVEIIGFEDE